MQFNLNWLLDSKITTVSIKVINFIRRSKDIGLMQNINLM